MREKLGDENFTPAKFGPPIFGDTKPGRAKVCAVNFADVNVTGEDFGNVAFTGANTVGVDFGDVKVGDAQLIGDELRCAPGSGL